MYGQISPVTLATSTSSNHQQMGRTGVYRALSATPTSRPGRPDGPVFGCRAPVACFEVADLGADCLSEVDVEDLGQEGKADQSVCEFAPSMLAARAPAR